MTIKKKDEKYMKKGWRWEEASNISENNGKYIYEKAVKEWKKKIRGKNMENKEEKKMDRI